VTRATHGETGSGPLKIEVRLIIRPRPKPNRTLEKAPFFARLTRPAITARRKRALFPYHFV